MVAKEFLYYNLLGIGAFPDYHTHFGVWGIIPTVADKLVYDIPLSNEEKELAERLGITNSVEKGVLPLPRDVQIAREYLIVGEETHSRVLNIAAANTSYTIENIYARENEFLVLTRIAAAPGATAQDIRFIVDRDDDHNYETGYRRGKCRPEIPHRLPLSQNRSPGFEGVPLCQSRLRAGEWLGSVHRCASDLQL
ncbi:unnamed protein product [marine sediment metagenome]|uniref:Uncharacterized protein n=1 Tax=marine sediment metagenome TaxID=412755 RepID=X1TJV6_9ZZZZ